jgi:hypothetical protein
MEVEYNDGFVHIRYRLIGVVSGVARAVISGFLPTNIIGTNSTKQPLRVFSKFDVNKLHVGIIEGVAATLNVHVRESGLIEITKTDITAFGDGKSVVCFFDLGYPAGTKQIV